MIHETPSFAGCNILSPDSQTFPDLLNYTYPGGGGYCIITDNPKELIVPQGCDVALRQCDISVL